MKHDTADQGRAELSAAALGEWNGYVEGVLRGIAHALNNRAAALSAVIELSRDPEDAALVGSILSTELERVADLVAAVRSVGTPKAGADAFTPADAASEALAVLRLHVEYRESRLTIDAAGAPPLRVQRWMFVRSLIALAASAKPSNAGAKVIIAGDGDWLVASVDQVAAPSTAVTPYVCEIARAMGGGPLKPEEGYGFRVPTLAALRRREAREV